MYTNYSASRLSFAAKRGCKARALYLGCCALGMAFSANAHEPRFITVDAPGAGQASGQGTGCFAYSDCSVIINNWGAITGYYLDPNNVFHGFVRSPEGKFTSFEAPKADTNAQDYNGTLPNAINDAGAITGVYYDVENVAHGFLRSPRGEMSTFDPPGSLGTVPIALNLESAIVGYYVDENGLFGGFLRRADGTFATWKDPNACNTANTATSPFFCGGTGAFNINVFGVIAGGYSDNSGNYVGHGLIRFPGGRLQSYEVPGAGDGFDQGTGCPGCSVGLNLFGATAGYYTDSNNLQRVYLRSFAGQTTTFTPGDPSLGANCFSDCPLGLNDWGAVTGVDFDANGVGHGFLRTLNGKVGNIDVPGAANVAPQAPWYWMGTIPVSINGDGIITGFYVDANNVSHGFLFFP